MRYAFYVSIGTLLVGGCVNTPRLENIARVTPQTVVDVVECELINARDNITRRNKQNHACYDERGNNVCESLEGYVAVAELSLQVDEQLALTPSFTHTDVVSKSLTRAFDWGLKFDSQASRTYTQSITFKISELGRKKVGNGYVKIPSPCVVPPTNVSLNGKLGLEEVAQLAFNAVDNKDYGVYAGDVGDQAVAPTKQPPMYPPPTVQSDEQYRAARRRAAGGGGKDKAKTAFGTSVEFVLILGVGATGPTFTLEHFKGPGKLLTTQRTDTHSVTVGFAKSEVRAGVQNILTNQSKLPSTLNRLLLQRP